MLGDHHLGELLNLERRAFLQRELAGLDLGHAAGRGTGHEFLRADFIGGLHGHGQGKRSEQGEYQNSNAAKHRTSSDAQPL
ncbi:hypothetical protein D9M70_649040 [compost metagenome]